MGLQEIVSPRVIAEGKTALPYPIGYDDNVLYRAKILNHTAGNLELREQLRYVISKDIIAFIDLFCCTKDPRRNPDVMPFICYDFQRTAILDIRKSIEDGTDILIDKSRDMGASWMVIYTFIWHWLYVKGSDFRVGSRTEDCVDRPKAIDTLFEKLRFTLERLPSWLLPAGFVWAKNSTYMKLYNPELGNVIVGESANHNFGSGGRSKAILLDEFSKWDNAVAESAWTSTADVTPCRIVVSTPVGSGNKFAQLALGTKAEKIKKITLHWTLHPTKAIDSYYLDGAGNRIPLSTSAEAYRAWRDLGIIVSSPWRDEEKNRRNPADLAQEIDIDYLQSGSPFFDIQAIKKQRIWTECKNHTPLSDVPYGQYIRSRLLEVNNVVHMREESGSWLKIYEVPQEGAQYCIGADTAEGLAKGDESFCVVRNRYTFHVVSVFHGLIDPEEFAYKLWMVGKYYNNAIVAPENNNHGYTVCLKMHELGSNLYYAKRDETGHGVQTTPKRGWTTDSRSRPLILDRLATDISKSFFEIRDEAIIKQCLTFVRNEKRGGKPEADGMMHDDGVMAMAICGQIIEENPYKAVKDTRTKQYTAINDIRLQRRNAGICYG